MFSKVPGSQRGLTPAYGVRTYKCSPFKGWPHNTGSEVRTALALNPDGGGYSALAQPWNSFLFPVSAPPTGRTTSPARPRAGRHSSVKPRLAEGTGALWMLGPVIAGAVAGPPTSGPQPPRSPGGTQGHPQTQAPPGTPGPVEKQTSPQTRKGRTRATIRGTRCAWLEGLHLLRTEPGRRPGEGMSKLRPEAKGGDRSIQAWESLGTDQQPPRSTPRARRCSRRGLHQAPRGPPCAADCCRKGRRGRWLTQKPKRELQNHATLLQQAALCLELRILGAPGPGPRPGGRRQGPVRLPLGRTSQERCEALRCHTAPVFLSKGQESGLSQVSI